MRFRSVSTLAVSAGSGTSRDGLYRSPRHGGNPYHRPGKTDGAGQFCSAEDAGFTVAAAPEHPASETAQVASVKTPENAPNQEQPSLKTPERPDTIRESDWNAMKAALDKRTDISDQEKATILSIFAWEGGLKDDGNGVIAGLLPSTLKTMGASTPKTAADAADLYVSYLDRSMHTIGGLVVSHRVV
jgi:hypothetical protein